MRRLDAFVKSAAEGVGELQDLVQGMFAREIITLDNLKADMQAQLSKLNANLVALQISEAPSPDPAKSEGKFEAGD